MKIDMHVHTVEGSRCSEVSVKDIIITLKNKGFNGVLITDHNSIEGWQSVFMDTSNEMKDLLKDFVVLGGVEYETYLGDMLVILPTVEVLTYEKIDTYELIEEVHKRNGIIGIPHMFRDRFSIGNNSSSNEEIANIVKLVDFIENDNGKTNKYHNDKANFWAKHYFKPTTKGSDTHKIEQIGISKTVFKVPIENEVDLINAIKTNKIKK